jgi:hypothetical protein
MAVIVTLHSAKGLSEAEKNISTAADLIALFQKKS